MLLPISRDSQLTFIILPAPQDLIRAHLDPEWRWGGGRSGRGEPVTTHLPYLSSCPACPRRGASGEAADRGWASGKGCGGGGLKFRHAGDSPLPIRLSGVSGEGWGAGGGGDGFSGEPGTRGE